MQQLPPFSGTGVAIITPFTTAGKIDFSALGRTINHVLAGGIKQIISLGTTGEASTLSLEECQQVIDFTLKEVGQAGEVIAGHFGGSNTLQLVKRLSLLDSSQLAGIMASSPAYSKPSQEGIFQHYLALQAATSLPIIIYNVPSRTGSNIEPATILRLANTSPQFAAVKEASGNLNQLVQIIKHAPKHFGVLCGEDPLALAAIALGAHGSISVIANAYPAKWHQMITAASAGNFQQARLLNAQLWDLHPPLYQEGNPVGIKTVMARLGFCENIVRLPLVTMSNGGQKELFTQMDKLTELVKVQ